MSTSRVPTWDEVRSASDELDQMASQTVLKACDVGDMLRAIRLTMDAGSFNARCASELNWSQQHANRLIVLSFRRSAVLDALANGTANDSIRSAYEHVKALPAPPDEEAERGQWPKAKRGPKAGSSNARRSKASAPSVTPTEWLRWVGYKSPGQTAKDINTWIEVNRSEANRHPETLDELTPLMLEAAAAVAPAVLERHAALVATQEEEAEATLSAVSKQSVAEVKAKLEKAIHARLLGEAQKAVAAAEEQIRAEYNEKLRQAWEEVDQKQAELNAAVKRLNNRMIGIRPLMTRNEWKGHVALCHRDQWPELKDDDVRIVRLNRLFHALQKMKDQIDPMTPIAELRATGWEDIAPAHKRNRRKSNG